ncbi:MFS transporter [Kitasatospora sp. NPDC059646]|uniref:MFS transporter n=1 Tax=Kitasatospora sp. NPDC059646 TaxID=3346893 RepID=UPI0036B49E84
MKSFWLLTGASSVSTMGNTFLYVAVPLALLQSTDSPLLAVLSVAAQNLPYLLAPLLGPFIDRYDRRVLFALGEVVQGLAVAAIPFALWHDEIWAVFLALFVIGLANVVSDVAGDYGLIPLLVPAEKLDRASARFTALLLAARFVGPALAGLIIAGLGSTWALELDAVTFLLTALTTLAMPYARQEPTETSLVAMLKEGVAFFRSRADLRRLTLVTALYNVGAGALESTLITVGRSDWQWSARTLGVAMSIAAVAAAIGAWLAPRALVGDDRRRQLTICLGVCGIGTLGLLTPWPVVMVAGFAVLCLGEGGINAATMGYRQQAIPDHLSGRVNAVIRTFVTGAVPVSSLLLGLTISLGSSALVFAPVTAAVGASFLLWSTMRRPGPAERPLPPVIEERIAQ